MMKYMVPIVVFVLLMALFMAGLRKDPTVVPSPLIGKPVPAFALPQLNDASVTLTQEDLKGKVTLLNVWGSYCIPCRQEHPLFMELAKQKVVDIYGLNYADERDAAIAWLQDLGDPYVKSAFDEDRRVSIDFGVYGVPETYVIDRDGVIRYKKVGAISKELLDETLLPMIAELNKR
jgi:cytochrome c biogenesis protein CcmG/thiol:disulfide interchange protein DsbE